MCKMCSLLLNLKNNNNHNNDLSELKRVPDIQFPCFSYVIFFFILVIQSCIALFQNINLKSFYECFYESFKFLTETNDEVLEYDYK